MPSLDPVAAIVRRTIATLEQKLPDAIAEFNANAENVIQLAEPTEYVPGAKDPLLVNGCLVEVAATQGLTGRWAVGNADVDHFPTLAVVIWHEGERGELTPAYLMSLGLRHCVMQVLSEPGAFGDGVGIANEENAVTWRIDPQPESLIDGTREFSKWLVPVLLTFKLDAVELFA